MMSSPVESGRRFNWRAGIWPAVGLFSLFGIYLAFTAWSGEIKIPSRGYRNDPPLVSREQSPQLFWAAWSILFFVSIVAAVVFFAVQSTEEK